MEEKMDTQQEEALAEDGAKKIQEAVDEEALAEAKEAVENMQQEAEQKAEEAAQTASRIAELKDELERLETGLPNAGATIQAIKDKQQKVPRRKLNTPDVNPGDVDAIAAAEAEKYRGALGPMPGMGSPMTPGLMGMGMPSMAAGVNAQAGPQAPTGPQTPVGARQAPIPPPRPDIPRRPKPSEEATGSIQLDPRTLLEIELIATKKRLAEANERLALVALNDARRAKQGAEREEAALMAQISKHYNIPVGKNVRLIDKDKGICMIED